MTSLKFPFVDIQMYGYVLCPSKLPMIISCTKVYCYKRTRCLSVTLPHLLYCPLLHQTVCSNVSSLPTWVLSCPEGYVLRCKAQQIRELSTARLAIGQAISIRAPIGKSMIIYKTCFPNLVPVMLKYNPNQGPQKLE